RGLHITDELKNEATGQKLASQVLQDIRIAFGNDQVVFRECLARAGVVFPGLDTTENGAAFEQKLNIFERIGTALVIADGVSRQMASFLESWVQRIQDPFGQRCVHLGLENREARMLVCQEQEEFLEILWVSLRDV